MKLEDIHIVIGRKKSENAKNNSSSPLSTGKAPSKILRPFLETIF